MPTSSGSESSEASRTVNGGMGVNVGGVVAVAVGDVVTVWVCWGVGVLPGNSVLQADNRTTNIHVIR